MGLRNDGRTARHQHRRQGAGHREDLQFRPAPRQRRSRHARQHQRQEQRGRRIRQAVPADHRRIRPDRPAKQEHSKRRRSADPVHLQQGQHRRQGARIHRERCRQRRADPRAGHREERRDPHQRPVLHQLLPEQRLGRRGQRVQAGRGQGLLAHIGDVRRTGEAAAVARQPLHLLRRDLVRQHIRHDPLREPGSPQIRHQARVYVRHDPRQHVRQRLAVPHPRQLQQRQPPAVGPVHASREHIPAEPRDRGRQPRRRRFQGRRRDPPAGAAAAALQQEQRRPAARNRPAGRPRDR